MLFRHLSGRILSSCFVQTCGSWTGPRVALQVRTSCCCDVNESKIDLSCGNTILPVFPRRACHGLLDSVALQPHIRIPNQADGDGDEIRFFFSMRHQTFHCFCSFADYALFIFDFGMGAVVCERCLKCDHHPRTHTCTHTPNALCGSQKADWKVWWRQQGWLKGWREPSQGTAGITGFE